MLQKIHYNPKKQWKHLINRKLKQKNLEIVKKYYSKNIYEIMKKYVYFLI